MTPASIIPVFGSQRPYADLNFAGGSFGLDGRWVSDLTALPGFTFTRASLAMGYDATGKLVYGPNNLVLQSQTFENVAWTATNTTVTANTGTAPDGTATADTINDGVATGAHLIGQSFTAEAGRNQIESYYFQDIDRRYVQLAYNIASFGANAYANFDLQSGTLGTVGSTATATITAVGGGWYRCSIAAVATVSGGATSQFALITSSTSARSESYTGTGKSLRAWGAQLEAVTYQTTPSTYYPTTTAAYYGPRLVYDPVTRASLGILVEEARTNVCLQSQTFDNASWTKTDATVVANAATSPDGTANADSITEGVAASTHRVYQSVTTTAVAWTISAYAKPNGRSWVYFRCQDSGNVARLAFFNVTTGVVGTLGVGVTGGTITAVGNGWYRCSATLTMFAGAQSVVLGISNADGVESYTGDGTSGAFIYQAQLEAGTGASSPIPTTTASVTRAADVARLTGLTLSYPTTLAAGFTKNFGAATSRAATFYIDGNNFTAVGLTSAGGTRLDVASGGAFQAQITGATVANGSAALVAGRVETNNVAFAAQGALAGVDTLATPPSPTTALNIGIFSDGGSEPFSGTISRIRIYNRALSDAQLQSLTT